MNTKSCGEYSRGQMRGKRTVDSSRRRTTGTWHTLVNQIFDGGKNIHEEDIVRDPKLAYYSDGQALCAIELTRIQ